MLVILESILSDILALGPEYLVLIGAHEVRLARPKRFIKVSQGHETALVEV